MSFAYLDEVFNSEENTFLCVMMMVVLPSFITIFFCRLMENGLPFCVAEGTLQCPCLENFNGTFCDECANGYFGFPDCNRKFVLHFSATVFIQFIRRKRILRMSFRNAYNLLLFYQQIVIWVELMS